MDRRSCWNSKPAPVLTGLGIDKASAKAAIITTLAAVRAEHE